MRIFTERYPEAATGMILVDATSPDTTLGFNGKLVHMRELAKIVLFLPCKTMKTGPPKLAGTRGHWTFPRNDGMH
jgi:hypothetical protein